MIHALLFDRVWFNPRENRGYGILSEYLPEFFLVVAIGGKVSGTDAVDSFFAVLYLLHKLFEAFILTVDLQQPFLYHFRVTWKDVQCDLRILLTPTKGTSFYEASWHPEGIKKTEELKTYFNLYITHTANTVTAPTLAVVSRGLCNTDS